jgi:hypothetical protein
MDSKIIPPITVEIPMPEGAAVPRNIQRVTVMIDGKELCSFDLGVGQEVDIKVSRGKDVTQADLHWLELPL